MPGELVLGSVVFRDFEVPEQLRFGGKQRLAVHVLPGGGRVVDAMGADEAPVSWSGVFSGPSAAGRAALLDQMRRDGLALALSWSGWRYRVVVERFEAKAVNPAWIPYRITACVVSVGDPFVAEPLPDAATVIEAGFLGVGPLAAAPGPPGGVDGAIDLASGQLQSDDLGVAIRAAGAVARLVAGRALLAAAGGVAS